MESYGQFRVDRWLQVRHYPVFKHLGEKNGCLLILNLYTIFNSEKFGLYHVDFEHPMKTRTPKVSAKVYGNIVKTRAIDWTYTPRPSLIQASSSYHLSSSSNSLATYHVFLFISVVLHSTILI